jgi:hypothetical protein
VAKIGLCRSQTRFAARRSIFDNKVLALETVTWAEESQQELVIMLLDFKKAYDKVLWTFLHSHNGSITRLS